MDFDRSEEQQAIADLTGQILADHLTHERLKEIEARGDWFADREWEVLAKAGLVGIALPEQHGGAGLGIFEACLVLEQIGRTVAPVPYLASVVLGAMPLAEFGSREQQAEWLPRVAEGTAFLTAALAERGVDYRAARPVTVARPDGDGWRLRGRKAFVPWADRADRILVPASDGDGVTVFLVDGRAEGVTLEPIATTNGEPQSVMILDDVWVGSEDVVGRPGEGAEIVGWLVDHGTAAVCATQAGVVQRALEMVGSYTSERYQFNAPIATFQAVAQRAADAYIDAHAVRFTSWQATWRLAEGLPAADALDVAKFWAAEGGQRVVHAAQHLHGGIGVDKDYPLHRYFLWAKLLELTLGGATERLRDLGGRLAAASG